MKKVWNQFWFRECPPHALALFRICLGVFLLIYALTYAPHITLLFSNKGLLLPLYFQGQAPTPTLALTTYCLLLTTLCFFTIGFHFRTSTALLIVLLLYYWQLSLHLFPGSHNRILFFTLCVLFFSEADATFSYRMWKEKGSVFAWKPVSIWIQRLLTIQITATYLGVGLQKVVLVPWQSGEVLSRSFMGMWASPLAFAIARAELSEWTYRVAVESIKICEILLPLGLWIQKFRLAAIVIGSVFHISIALLLGIWWFVFLLPAYILFFPPEYIKNVIEYICPSVKGGV